MKAEFYDHKNIYKLLNSSFGSINLWSDTGYENIKNCLMKKYNKNDLKIIYRKLIILYKRRYAVSDFGFMQVIFGAALSGIISAFLVYLSIRFSYINNFTEPLDFKDINSVLSDDLSSFLVNLFVATTLSTIIFGIHQYRDYKIKIRMQYYILILEDCLEIKEKDAKRASPMIFNIVNREDR